MSRNRVPIQRHSRQAGAQELARLSHDLRQCVSAGLLLASLPSEQAVDAQTQRRFELLRQTLSHAAELVETMSEESTPRQRVVDLAQLSGACVDVAQVGHRIGLTCDTWHAPVVLADPLMVRRAIDNMIDNAVRAAGDLGIIAVRVGSDLVDVWVEVSDNGPGFGQIEHGTGRGLSVVTSAVRAAGGHLTINSGPGPGTTVRLTFPWYDANADGRSPQSAEPSAYSLKDAFQSPYPL